MTRGAAWAFLRYAADRHGGAQAAFWFALVNSPFTHFMTEDDQVSETQFTVRRINGPEWKIPADRISAPRDRVVERMVCWDDKPHDLTIFERSKDHLIAFVAIAFISILARRLKRLVAEELSA